MNTITYQQFIKHYPLGLKHKDYKLFENALKNKELTIIEFLSLKKTPPKKRLETVLREEFISKAILHEFALRCAEKALKLAEVENYIALTLILAKRDFLKGNITKNELKEARKNFYDYLMRNRTYFNLKYDAEWLAYYATEIEAEEATRGLYSSVAHFMSKYKLRGSTSMSQKAIKQTTKYGYKWQIKLLKKLLEEEA